MNWKQLVLYAAACAVAPIVGFRLGALVEHVFTPLVRLMLGGLIKHVFTGRL